VETSKAITRFITHEILSGISDDAIGETDALIESGIIDSMGIMKLIAFVEREFGVQFAGDELVPDNFENIGAISRLINEKLNLQVKQR